ncbi:MAG: hypothetical protein PHU12_00210 [Candidatus Aenigmarchaeota archaeon]|nr:hypothetical protein [Candidatus Aenigmarchaeota archaeon]
MKKILALFAIIMIVAVSGCVGGKNVAGKSGYGLEILNFSSSADSLFSKQTSIITMQVENQGGAKVNSDNGLALLIIPTDWEITQPAGEYAQAYKKDINFEDTNKGTVAGIDYFKWTVKAPPLAQGQTSIYPIIGRIYYDYQTTLSGNIWIYPEAELYSENQKGSKLEKSSYNTTRGPISISMSVAPDPVPIYSDGEIFPITITLKNVGGGTVYKNDVVTSSYYDLPESYRDRVTLGITTPSNLVINDPTCTEDIIFFGDTATIMCDVKVVSAPKTKQLSPISINVYYGYYTEKQISVTVNGKETISDETPTPTPTPSTDYVLDADITIIDSTTTSPTPAKTINFCPGSKIGSNYKFIVSDVTSASAKIRVEGLPDASDTAENTITKGSTWETERNRASFSITINSIDTTSKIVKATIVVDKKVQTSDRQFVTLTDSTVLTSPLGTAYTFRFTGLANTSSGASGYPQALNYATFDVNGNTITVYRNTAGQCIKTLQVGSEWIGIGIDNSATAIAGGDTPTTGSIKTILAVGTSRTAVEDSIRNGYYASDSCSAALTQITLGSSC